MINEYEQFIRKIEKQYGQKTDEYEKRIEMLLAKTHEQLKSIEGLLIETQQAFSFFLADEFEERNTKQQSIIGDQQKMIQVLKDEQTKAKAFFDKQASTLNEQCLREKSEIKAVRSFATRPIRSSDTLSFLSSNLTCA